MAASLLLLGGCGAEGDGAPSSPRSPSSSSRIETPDALERVLLLDFESTGEPLTEGARLRSDTSGGPTAVVHLAGSVTQPLTVVGGQDDGRAVAFPGPCPATTEATCPKAVIEVDDDPSLNPDADDFGFGASVLLQPDQTSKGSNLVQKGFSRGGGSQWKLQVDGLDGRPSCILVGMGDDTVHQARADVSVADGTWHDVSCRRTDDELAILVDDEERAATQLPPGLSVAPLGLLRIGGKSLKPNNDQYFGALDDVYVDAPQ